MTRRLHLALQKPAPDSAVRIVAADRDRSVDAAGTRQPISAFPDIIARTGMEADGLKFTITEPDQIDDGNGDWGFSILADKDVFIATVSYPSQADAIRGQVAMAQALKEAVFIATTES